MFSPLILQLLIIMVLYRRKLKEIVDSTSTETFVESFDQLRRAKKNKEAFTEFAEPPVFFNPTYRLMVCL